MITRPPRRRLSRLFSFVLVTVLVNVLAVLGLSLSGCRQERPPYEGFEGVVTYSGKLVRSNMPLSQVIYFKGNKIREIVTPGPGRQIILLADFDKDSVTSFSQDNISTEKLPDERLGTDSILQYTGKTATIGKYETKVYKGPLAAGMSMTMYLTGALQPNVRHAIERSLLVGSSQGRNNQQKIYAQLRTLDMVPVRMEVTDPMNALVMQIDLISIEPRPVTEIQ